MEAIFNFSSKEEMEEWKREFPPCGFLNFTGISCINSSITCIDCQPKNKKWLDSVCHVLPDSPLQISEKMRGRK